MPANALRPRHARCDTSPIVIVNVRLSTLNDAGTPARVTYAALQAYYTGDRENNLVFIDAPYDLTSKQAAHAFKEAVDQAMRTVDGCEIWRYMPITSSERGLQVQQRADAPVRLHTFRKSHRESLPCESRVIRES